MMKFRWILEHFSIISRIIDTREIEFPVENRDSSGTIPFYQSVINSFPTYRRSDEKNFDPFFFLSEKTMNTHYVIVRYQQENISYKMKWLNHY